MCRRRKEERKKKKGKRKRRKEESNDDVQTGNDNHDGGCSNVDGRHEQGILHELSAVDTDGKNVSLARCGPGHDGD